jgi:hypothetical protein
MATATADSTIFRFKFTPEFTSQLLSFAKLHQYHDRVTYKEEWTRWIQNNDALIDDESRRMKAQGYNGNIIDKMYKSGRYYFRKKTTHQPKVRRQYISLDKYVIEAMDNHILQNYGTPLFKPSISYEQFCIDLDYSELIDEEYNRLIAENLTKEDINKKIKKTYKNRYFLFSQNNHIRDIHDIRDIRDITKDNDNDDSTIVSDITDY